MKKLIFTLASFLLTLSALSATINVPTDQPTIQAAVNAASPGDIIQISAGTYDDVNTIIINKSLTIAGPISGGAIIRNTAVPTALAKSTSVFEIVANNVIIQNLEITVASSTSYSSTIFDEQQSALIRIPNGLGLTGVVLANNTLYVPLQSGFMTTWGHLAITVGDYGSNGITISNNKVYNTRNGIVVRGHSFATVTNNVIYNTKGGIMNYTADLTDSNNRVMAGNSWGSEHNEWDIVWNTFAYFTPDYQLSVLQLSNANNGAYVVDRRAASAALCATLTGNRSHVFVNVGTGTITAGPVNGNINLPYKTVALGISAAVTGGTVYVAAGTYPEQVTINKALTLNGDDGAVLDGTGLSGWTTGVKIKTGNVTFNNIDVTNFSQDGIIAYIKNNSPNIHITNCKISNIQPGYWGFGIYIGWESEAFKYSPPHMTTQFDYSGLLVENNEITNVHSSALVLQAITGTPGTLLIRNNFIHDNTTNDGIWIDCARNLIIENNNVVGNKWGIELTSYGDAYYGSDYDWDTRFQNTAFGPKDITISGNNIIGSLNFNFGLWDGWPATINLNNNNILGNPSAIKNYLPGNMNATCNWYGDNNPSVVASMISGPVTYIPFSISAGGSCIGGLPVHNITQNTHFSTIQSAINASTTLNGDVIVVDPGNYPENISITKSITLQGANFGQNCDNRGQESLIAPASGVPITLVADGVTINGFELTAPGANYAIIASGRSNINILFNNIHDIGTTVANGNIHSIVSQVPNGVACSNLSITDNCFNNIGNSNNIRSATAIGILQSTSTGTISNVLIEKNSINNVNSKTALADGRGAYGIQINTGASAIGSVNNAIIRSNSISNLSGKWSHGIGLEGNTPGAVVINNTISNLLSNPSPGDACGVMIEQNSGASTLSISNNSFTNESFGIINKTNSLVNANCNWYGSADLATVNSSVLGPVTFAPYLDNGTDSDPAIGFQPAGNCTGGLPRLSATINEVTVISDNDGADNSGSFSFCNEPGNMVFGPFTELSGYTGSNVKAYQKIELANVSTEMCNECSAPLTAFNRHVPSVNLVDPALPGTLVMKFKVWIDSDNDGVIDLSENQANDWVVFTITVNPLPSFSFDIAGSHVANINNVATDPGESVTVAVCDGGTYQVTNLLHSSPDNRYKIGVTALGGGLLFNGNPAGNGDISSAQFDGVVGVAHTITLVDETVGGSVVQVITPYNPVTGCEGEPITITYVVNDLEKPVVKTKNIEVELDENGEATIVAADVDDGSTDNCTIKSMTISPNSFTCENIGENTVTLTVKDKQGNEATGEAVVTVINGLPVINSLTVTNLATVGSLVTANATFTDNNLNAATWDWGDGSNSAGVVTSSSVTGTHLYTATGLYDVKLVITDVCGETSEKTFSYVVVVNACDDKVTAGGWFELVTGSYPAKPTLKGKAMFEFEVKLSAGVVTQPNRFKLQIKENKFEFNSTSINWLMVNNDQAIFVGSGKVNGAGSYSFLVSLIDGNLDGNKKSDLLRIVIKDNNGGVVFDNQPGQPDAARATQPVQGSIQIHKGCTNKSGNKSATIIPDNLSVKLYPNPTTGRVTVKIENHKNPEVSLEVLNIAGQKVHVNKYYTLDYIDLDLRGNSSGLYFVTMIIDGNSIVKKVNLVEK